MTNTTNDNFELVPALAKKDYVTDLKLCRVLFEDNKAYPWIFLIPKKSHVKNMLGLSSDERLQLMREIEKAETVMNTLFKPTQLNTAAIGNMTPQLHVHIICRYEGDPGWPGTVWGLNGEKYDPTTKAETISKIKQALEA